MMVDTAELVARIEVLSLEPGDILAVTYPVRLRGDFVFDMTKHLMARFGDKVQVVVLDSDPTLSVIRPANAEES